jgi:hypothetical protein
MREAGKPGDKGHTQLVGSCVNGDLDGVGHSPGLGRRPDAGKAFAIRAAIHGIETAALKSATCRILSLEYWYLIA